VAVRREVFEQDGRETPRGRSRQAVIEGAIRDGWGALTYPDVMGSIVLSQGASRRPGGVRPYSATARALQRLHAPLLQWFLAATPAERRALVQRAIRNPARTARGIAERAARALA
jgi:hypothetical protein